MNEIIKWIARSFLVLLILMAVGAFLYLPLAMGADYYGSWMKSAEFLGGIFLLLILVVAVVLAAVYLAGWM